MKKGISLLLAVLLSASVFGCFAFADSYAKTFLVSLDKDASSLIQFVSIDPAELEGKVAAPETFATSDYVTEKKLPDGAAALKLSDCNYTVIAVRAKGSNLLDQTSVIKIYPQSANIDIVTGKEYGDRLPKALKKDIEKTLGSGAYEKQNYGTSLFVVGNASNFSEAGAETIKADFAPLRDKDGDYINEHGEKLNKKLKDDGTYLVLEPESYLSKIIYVFRFYNVTEDITVKAYNVSSDSIGGVRNFVMNLLDFFRQLFSWFFGLFQG